MQCSNDQAGQLEEAKNEKCDVCGSGYTPDERMNFEGSSVEEIIESARGHLTQMFDSYMAADCCLAKVSLMMKQSEKG